MRLCSPHISLGSLEIDSALVSVYAWELEPQGYWVAERHPKQACKGGVPWVKVGPWKVPKPEELVLDPVGRSWDRGGAGPLKGRGCTDGAFSRTGAAGRSPVPTWLWRGKMGLWL